MESVLTVLHEIGAADNPQLLVYNKIDLLEHTEPHIDRDGNGRPQAVWLSAASGVGIELLVDAIRELLSVDMVAETLHLGSSLGRFRVRFFALNAVQSERVEADGSAELKIRMPRADFNRLLKAEGVALEQLKIVNFPEDRETA